MTKHPVGTGGTGPSTGIEMSVEALKDFERTIQGVITDLQHGTVPMDNVIDNDIAPGAYGQGFDEADSLHRVMTSVTQTVQKAAQTFHKHIEAMQLSIQLTYGDTSDTDESIRRQYANLLSDLSRDQAAGTASGTPLSQTPTSSPTYTIS